jgi:hypothetical protein
MQEEGSMKTKKSFPLILGIILGLGVITPAHSQTKKLCEFKNVVIPFILEYEEGEIQKGTYNFEVRKDVNQSAFFLRIKKKRRTICRINGEKLMYKSFGTRALFDDPTIPDDPKLRFKKVPEEKIVNIIFESGKRTKIYPCIKVQFQMGYK